MHLFNRWFSGEYCACLTKTGVPAILRIDLLVMFGIHGSDRECGLSCGSYSSQHLVLAHGSEILSVVGNLQIMFAVQKLVLDFLKTKVLDAAFECLQYRRYSVRR